MTQHNAQIRLASRPQGLPADENWSLTHDPAPAPQAGSVLIKTRAISLDPAMRGWMNDAKSYAPPVQIGAVMRAFAIGEVIESADGRFAPGDIVIGMFGVQQYATLPGDAIRKIDPALAPLYLSVLGVTGMTAYFGLLEVGALRDKETVVVSAAAGAVGSIVGQIAKIKGATAIGLAGGPIKCAYLTDELGFDAAIDYKCENVFKALREHAPDGIDVYFDNVGGDILDAALANLRMHARVVICGAISQYNSTGPVAGPKNYMSLLVNRARMEGFLVMDYGDRFPAAEREMAGWLQEGKLKSREEIVRGTVADFPKTFLKLFTGENTGKLILELHA